MALRVLLGTVRLKASELRWLLLLNCFRKILLREMNESHVIVIFVSPVNIALLVCFLESFVFYHNLLYIIPSLSVTNSMLDSLNTVRITP